MKLRKFFAASLLATSIVILSGCSDKIDTSSDTVMEASIQQVLEGKSKVEVAKFQDSLSTITNYSYAVTHDGRTLDGLEALNLVLSSLSNDTKTKNASDEMDKLLSSILNGMTYNDVVNSKSKYDEKLSEIVKDRQAKQAEYNAKQAKVNEENRIKRQAEQVKIDEQNAIRRKEMAIKQIAIDIQSLRDSIDSNKADIERYTLSLKPYNDAANAFSKISDGNIKISEQNGKKWYLSFDVVNNSDLTLYSVNYDMLINLNGEKYQAANSNKLIREGIAPGATYTVVLDKTASSLKREPASNISMDITLKSFIAKIDGKDYVVSKQDDDVNGPRFMNDGLQRAKETIERNNAKIIELQTKQETLQQ